MLQKRNFIKEFSETQMKPNGMVLVDMEILKTHSNSSMLVITDKDMIPTDRTVAFKPMVETRRHVPMSIRQAQPYQDQLLDSMKGNREMLKARLDKQKLKLDLKNAEAFKGI